MNNLLKMTGFVPVILGVLCACQSTSTEQHNDTYIEDLYEALPFDMPVVQRPSFPDYQVDIRDFGAKADGETLNTEAINNAIKAVSEKGGGKVVIPEGLWLTGPVVLQNNVNLHVEKNALVLFSGDADLYPLVRTSFEGLDMLRCQSPISAMNAENIAITGYGVLDGSGDSWRPVKRNKMTDGQWKSLLKSGGVVDESGKVWYPNEGALKASILTGSKEKREISDSEWEGMKRWLRPVLLSIVKSKRVLLEGVTFRNSPSWCLHPLSCEDLTLNGVKVFNPWYSQNGDALDVESCKNVVVTNSLFDAGDDAICIKSGKDADGRRRGEPCENVLVKNNTVLHGHGGFVVGSEMSGGVRNVYVADCTFIGTDVGLRFKSTRGRGGVVENVYVDNINMINIPGDALIADLYYAVKDAPGAPVPAVTEETPSFKNIHISNISCKGAGRAMFLNGLPEMPIENFSVRNMRITDAQKGAFINKVAGVTLENIEIETADNTYLQVENTTNITIDGKEYDKISEKRLLTQN
ncbi:glycoside hydrolase family 28 protein [Bacteroides clarus]|uniref:Glycoside hydrolase family 28 protein n=1 Tax=Bacteroides clarus TaxID=626929 RepID=A0A412YGD3_9BACE|nr:glycoside hydrolase family 28 protein [Bacteroides clarus]RGV39800.1 glycoside hydrolase family 28 protein [Bacteroides clarus]RGV56472.1 glycoside hydrolase family 28 protein [Bacteroides clarus]